MILREVVGVGAQCINGSEISECVCSILCILSFTLCSSPHLLTFDTLPLFSWYHVLSLTRSVSKVTGPDIAAKERARRWAHGGAGLLHCQEMLGAPPRHRINELQVSKGGWLSHP